tara:strand:- start:63 stop:254 length:192 start_codon:yes stop_codon:yes gene_type:complete
MFKLLRDLSKVYNLPKRKNIKCIRYETIDFVPQVFKNTPLIVKPTEYKIPNVSYEEQYENRDC